MGFNMGPIWGIPYVVNMGFATGIHLGPIWAGPYGQRMGPIWVNTHLCSREKKTHFYTNDYKSPAPAHLTNW